MAFHHYINKYKDNNFLEDDSGITLTYAETLDTGASLLKGLGKAKSLIFLLCNNRATTIAVYIALLCSEHVVMLLDEKIDSETLDSLTNAYKPDYIYRSEKLIRLKGDSTSPKLNSNLSLLMSTSGSSGSPKFSRFSCQQLISNAEAIATSLNINERDKAFAHLPIHYSFGLSIVNSHLVTGAQLRVTEFSLLQSQFWAALRESNSNSLSGVPYHFEMMKRLRHPYKESTSLRYLAQAGGNLSSSLVEEFAANIELYVMYGQTEAGPRITTLPSEYTSKLPHSVGRPLTNVRLEICDNQGAILPANCEGELICHSPSIMLGYALNRDDLALGDQMSGRLTTGDIAKIDENGFVYLVGRTSRFLKIQGNRVSLDDVEKKCAAAGFSVACLGSDDLLSIIFEGDQSSVTDYRTFTTATLRIPPRSVEIKTVSALSRKASGKIDYQALTKLFT